MSKKDNASKAFLKSITKNITNEFASFAEDGTTADISGYIDTGSYIFNALVSGSIYGGIPANSITTLAGESTTGKTFFVLGLMKKFLETNSEGGVIFFESESAVTKSMMEERSIDTKRVIMLPVNTIQEFRNQVLTIIENYKDQSEGERKPLLIVLDSFGMLSTTKEMTDSKAGSETKDMTRAAVAKATFRACTMELAKLKFPMVVTNHTYAEMGLFPRQIMSGGGGLFYCSSTIVFFSKRKEKQGKDIIGNIIHCRLHKGRNTQENKMVDVLLTYKEGLDEYYGLLDLAEKYEIFIKKGNKYIVPHEDGKTYFAKSIVSNPEKFFTEDILNELDKCAGEEFLYGSSQVANIKEEKETDGETEN